MKTLYLIGGTMGVGKATVCRELKKTCPTVSFWMATGAGVCLPFFGMCENKLKTE